jgi:hypothetical protein
MRGNTARDQAHFLQPELLLDFQRRAQVPEMHRVESAAEYADHRHEISGDISRPPANRKALPQWPAGRNA